MIITKIQDGYVHNKSFDQLLDISPKNLDFKKHLIQNLHKFKYILLIKIPNRYRQKIKKLLWVLIKV